MQFGGRSNHVPLDKNDVADRSPKRSSRSDGLPPTSNGHRASFCYDQVASGLHFLRLFNPPLLPSGRRETDMRHPPMERRSRETQTRPGTRSSMLSACQQSQQDVVQMFFHRVFSARRSSYSWRMLSALLSCRSRHTGSYRKPSSYLRHPGM